MFVDDFIARTLADGLLECGWAAALPEGTRTRDMRTMEQRHHDTLAAITVGAIPVVAPSWPHY